MFSPKQRTVLTWWRPGSPFADRQAIICDGAVRSGKTLCTGLSFFCWAMSSFHERSFALCGKTITSVRRNLLQELLPMLELEGEAVLGGSGFMEFYPTEASVTETVLEAFFEPRE